MGIEMGLERINAKTSVGSFSFQEGERNRTRVRIILGFLIPNGDHLSAQA